MARTIRALAGILCFSAATATAQITPPLPRPTPPASPGTTRQSDPPVITVTGCLKPWDASVMAPAVAPAGAAAGRFLLTNLEANAPGTTPGTAAGEAPPPNTQYVVTGDSAVNLAAHVNHKVRIEGQLATTDAAAPPPGRNAKGSGADRWAALAATSITMVSATCTGASD